MSQEKEKLVIIGSGPAGLTAAIYAQRAGLSPLLIEGKQPGGQLITTTYIENWPGNKRILGIELMNNMREHAQSLGVRTNVGEITRSDFSTQPFVLWNDQKEGFRCDSIIVATGSRHRSLRCSGEETYWARGVSTCAVCDGAFYKDKKVIIVGGGDTAMEDASFMAHLTDKITIVHILDTLTASRTMQERVLNNPIFNIIYNSTVTTIHGNSSNVTHVTITNQKTGKEQTIETDAVFIAIGLLPNSRPFEGQLALDSSGFIKVTNRTCTSVPGIFAAGDVVDSIYRQAITAAGAGCMAALDAEKYLQNF